MRGVFHASQSTGNGNYPKEEDLKEVGTFEVVIKYIKDGFTKSNKDPKVSILFKVISGEHQGKIIWNDLIFAKKGSPAECLYFRVKHFLESIGEYNAPDSNGEVFYDSDNWKNKTLTIEVQKPKDKYEVVYIKQQEQNLEDSPL